MIISTIAFGFLFLGSIVVLVRRFKVLKRMGTCENGFSRKSNRQFAGILLCSPLLIGLGFWRDYGALPLIVISCAGLMAFLVSLSDILFIGIGGLYENGLIWNSTVVFFDRVRSFAQIDPFTIEIQLAWRGRKTFVFSSPELAQSLRAKLEN